MNVLMFCCFLFSLTFQSCEKKVTEPGGASAATIAKASGGFVYGASYVYTGRMRDGDIVIYPSAGSTTSRSWKRALLEIQFASSAKRPFLFSVLVKGDVNKSGQFLFIWRGGNGTFSFKRHGNYLNGYLSFPAFGLRQNLSLRIYLAGVSK